MCPLFEHACVVGLYPFTFAVVYATTKLGLSRQSMLDALIVAAPVAVATIPLFGWLSDIYGEGISDTPLAS